MGICRASDNSEVYVFDANLELDYVLNLPLPNSSLESRTITFRFADHSDVADDARLQQIGWTQSNSNGQTHPVGQKEVSRFGLYDLHGNVLSMSGTKLALILSQIVNSRIYLQGRQTFM